MSETRHTAVDLHSDSANQPNLCVNSLVEQSQSEDGHGQVEKTQRAVNHGRLEGGSRAHLSGDGNNSFANGSKNKEGVGAGVYGKNSDTSLVVLLGPYSTVLQTELRPYSNSHA